MGTFQQVNNQVLSSLSLPLTGVRLTRRQQRQLEIERLQTLIIQELDINKRAECDKTCFRFNDLTEPAQRKYVVLFQRTTNHASIYKLKKSALLDNLRLVNPTVWGGSWSTQLGGSEAPKWRVNTISSWLYKFLYHPEDIHHGGTNNHSWSITTPGHYSNYDITPETLNWVERGEE
jgi:hypothetical protein